MELATKLVYRYEGEVNSGSVKVNDEKITDEVIDTVKEEFLEEIFGNNSKVTRKEYMNDCATKAHWVFNSSEIRKKIDKSSA